MPRGGRREGSGRPTGSVTVRNKEIVERASAEGITPLEVMLQAMRQRWGSGDVDGAVQVAEKAAPYIHARLSAVDATSKGERLGYVIAAPVEAVDADEWAKQHQPHH